MFGSYINSRGTRGTKMSANEDITLEIYVQQGKTINMINNQFFIHGPKCENKLHFWLFGEPWARPAMNRLVIY